MAKLGEGDPRWLVAERKDGTNVNGWHWVEKDVTEWCTERLKELFTGVSVPMSGGLQLTITGLGSCTGEAVINNRKQKIIPSYELEIKLDWEGSSCAEGKAAKGKLHFPYVADENHDEEPELKFALSVDDEVSNKLKQAFMADGKKLVQERIAQFVKELRAGGSATQPPTAASTNTTTTTTTAVDGSQAKPKLSSADPQQVGKAAAAAKAAAAPKGKSGATLKLKEEFYCRPEDIMECLTQEGRLRAFTQSPATSDPRVQGSFSWFGGSVQGTYTELEPAKKICMDWRFNTWEDGCVSKVVISLEEPEPGHTILKLVQTAIPEVDKLGTEGAPLEMAEKGWRMQVFDRLRRTFGYGVGL